MLILFNLNEFGRFAFLVFIPYVPILWAHTAEMCCRIYWRMRTGGAVRRGHQLKSNSQITTNNQKPSNTRITTKNYIIDTEQTTLHSHAYWNNPPSNTHTPIHSLAHAQERTIYSQIVGQVREETPIEAHLSTWCSWIKHPIFTHSSAAALLQNQPFYSTLYRPNWIEFENSSLNL